MPELPSPKDEDSSVNSQESRPKKAQPFIALRPQDEVKSDPQPPESDAVPSFAEAPAGRRETRDAGRPSSSKQTSPAKKYKILGIIAAIIVLLIITVIPGIAVARAYFAANEAKQALSQMEYYLEQGDFENAQRQADIAKNAFDAIPGILRQVGFWRDLPYVGLQIRTVEDASLVSSQSLDGVSDLLQVAAAMSEALFLGQRAASESSIDVNAGERLKDLTKQEKRELLKTLYDSLPQIRLARDKIEIALELWQSMPQDGIAGPIKDALQPLATALPIMSKSLDQVVPLIEVFVPLAGYPVAQQYVIAMQNADEIRPAGGFIGSIITADMEAGHLNDYEFFDVYSIDNPASGVWSEVPPAPMQQQLGVTKWFMRDANWSPDFPESAERVLTFYEGERTIPTGEPPPKPTGFIALEPGFFASLLSLTGPLNVQGRELNEQNFLDVLQYEVEVAPGITRENRKDFMGAVGQVLLEKIESLPRSSWPNILNILTRSLDQKQIMIYSRQPDVQQLVDAHNWSARTKPTQGDFLWIIDANLAAQKTDGVMKKVINYNLDLTNPEKPLANVTLKYTNTTRQITWRYTRYRSYTRVYVPEGSKLVSSKGAMKGDLVQTQGKFVAGTVDVMKELGKTVFGAFWSIEPNRTGELSFTYELPPASVADLATNGYRLDWPKQAGVDNAEFNVNIKLPMSIKSASPPEPEDKWGDNNYQVQTDSLYDRTFHILLNNQ